MADGSRCDSAGEFSAPQIVTAGTNYRSPEVIIADRAATRDILVFVEVTPGVTPLVKLLSVCGATGSSFVDEGALPLVPGGGYGLSDAQRLGGLQSWARSQVYFDGDNVHLSFMQEKPGKSTLNVMHYQVGPSQVCP